MTTDMTAVIREADKRDFARKERVTVAVNAGNPNYDVFLKEHFPTWREIYFKDTAECLKAIADGQADCLLISSYRYNDISATCEQYGLTTWSTGVEMDYCFAMNRGDLTLYSILAKVAGSVPDSVTNSALTYYFTEDARDSLAEFIRQNLWTVVMGMAALVALIASLLLLRRVRQRERHARSLRKPPTQEDFAFLDDMPVSYSVYHVTHIEHSELYDAEIVYFNHAFEVAGKLPVENAVGHHVRELFPYVEEEWFHIAKRAAIDGERVERDYVDPLKGNSFRLTAWRVKRPGYCAFTYQVI
jgi:PAS domain-containing protein